MALFPNSSKESQDRIPLGDVIYKIKILNKKAPQTNPDSQYRSAPALELHSRAASSVSVMSPFQQFQHRKQFRRKADQKKI